MSVADIIGEAEELERTSRLDKEALFASGINQELLESLSDRIGAYSVANSEYNTVAFAKSDAKIAWEEVEPTASKHRSKLIHYLRFAFKRNDMKPELKVVTEIAKGRGRRDLMIDMMDLQKLIEKHLDIVTPFGMTIADGIKAEELFETLRSILGGIDTPAAEVTTKKKLAQQAYTYLWESVDEIREFGQFLFWEDDKKLDLYRSDHYQRVGKLSHSTVQN
jgi:hypothetical protein